MKDGSFSGTVKVFNRALAGEDISKLSDKEIIEKVYKDKYNNISVDFKKSKNLHPGLRERFKEGKRRDGTDSERTKLLKLCD